jgi:putative ABC transport system permease protein
MTTYKLILRTLRQYPWSGLATAAGIAIATSIICGALIIGDSLSKSLEQIVNYRLGETTHTCTAGERVFTQQLAYRLSESETIDAAPVLKSEAIVSVQETGARVNKVNIWGVDSSFMRVIGGDPMSLTDYNGGIVVSENLAARLKVDTGEFVLMRIRTVNPIPANTPFVSEEGQTVTQRVAIAGIIQKEAFGQFNLQSSQTAPYNIFVDLGWLNQVMDLNDRANMIVVNTSDDLAEIQQQLKQNIEIGDLGLNLARRDSSNDWKLTAERVFLDDAVSETVKELFPSSVPYLTYFANSLLHDGLETPYSFVTATSGMEQIKDHRDMVVNQWLADDLGMTVGDSVVMRYFVVGPLRELEEKEEWFRVADIISMEQSMGDSILMPHLPGLSDAGSCRDWDTGIPIDLDKIRQKDEDYWDTYRGTPKAYISLEKGMQLWQNRFGNLTTVIFPIELYDRQQILQQLTTQIDPFRLEFQVNPVREQGLQSARGGVDFGQLFAGLGIFIIVSGLLLTALLLQYSLQRRQNQIRLFASLGFSQKLIRRIIMAEASLIIFVGAVIGMVVSLGYTRLVFAGLNRIWYDIVRTDVLQMHFGVANIIIGLVASIILGLVVIYFGTGKIIRTTISKETGTDKRIQKGRIVGVLGWATAISSVVFLIALIYILFLASGSVLFLWLTAGIVLLITLLMGLYYRLLISQRAGSGKLTFFLLSWKNLTRNPARSFTIITLLALGSFVIVVTAANQKDMAIDPTDITGGTGGFAFIAETTVPILRNLNEPETHYDFGLPDSVDFVQFMTTYDDDASCHNLNRVANPRLIATQTDQLTNRFSFIATHPLLDSENPWGSLNQEYDGFIPAIADQSVIQWGLGKKVGDTLYYINAKGEEIRVLLIGGLANSVLQGNVVIAQEQLLANFPATGGASVFLIDYGGNNASSLENELQFIFREYGWEMLSTPDKLAGFNSVENTYLQIFFLLGALGMLLGTIGLAVVIARSMLERSNETAMFRAMGYPGKTILRIYFTENSFLFLVGLITGTLSGLIATMPSYLAGSQNVNPGFLIGVLVVLILNGFFWIGSIIFAMLKKRSLELVRMD